MRQSVSLKTLVDIAGKPMLAGHRTVSAVAPGAPVLCGPALGSVRRLLGWSLAEGGAGCPAPSARARGLWSQAEAEGCALLLTLGIIPS